MARRAVPLFASVGIVGAIVFAPSGLRARDVLHVMDASIGVRAALWGVWTMLATPVVGAAFDAPGTRTLRSLGPRRSLTWMLVVLAALVQAPVFLLFARGGGPLQAATATLLGVSTCASVIAVSRAYRSAVWLVAACAAVLVDSPLMLAPAVLLAHGSVRAAWRTALEQRGAVRIVRRAPPALALASAYLARMVREERARLQASLAVVFAGGGALALSLRNDLEAENVPRTLLVLALPISVASALLAAPALETEGRMLHTLRAARIKPLTLALGTVLALALPSTAWAASAGATVACALHRSHAITLAASMWAVGIASVVAIWARRASRARRGSTFVVGVIAIGALFTALAATC